MEEGGNLNLGEAPVQEEREARRRPERKPDRWLPLYPERPQEPRIADCLERNAQRRVAEHEESRLRARPGARRSAGGDRPAVARRWAGTSRRSGGGRGASMITAATSLAGGVIVIALPASWAAK
jgi:hypothetical protein